MTDEEKIFLEKHNIPQFLTIDALGKNPNEEFRKFMKGNNFYFAFNTAKCQKGGHTIKDRYHHCIVCMTSCISFALRNSVFGFVYIAGSECGEFVKIGFTKEKVNREESLNRTKYGGFNDWKILFSVSCQNAGLIEQQTKSSLNRYQAKNIEYKNGKKLEADELFRCSYPNALEIVKGVLNAEKIEFEIGYEFKDNKGVYNFRNLIKVI